MTKIKQQRYHHELLSIALIGNLWQNTHTTKLKAVKPSRHSLAIFTLTVSDNSATGVNIYRHYKIRTVSPVMAG